ncbi:hypothetical protein N7474_008364 [Penicillium riverlandense]|uniref:uncharacterized protein n=1 Tax=Penicillium riverlandense TaxID=1903569 RepID=UPI002546BB64|nr:uncharacterized protein N7474_008364 [Penicillium riverlandense]KAJ5812063.1 hypothetical protein N7474_008364 [Penicillium riverlandense]
MGNLSSIPGHDCLLKAVSHNADLVAFRGDPFFQFHALPLYNLNLPVAPAVIMYPKTTDQVAAIVRCAAEYNYKVQAHSGGHSYGNYGLGGSDGALVVDLKHFQQFSMNNHTHVATIGAGTLLGDVQMRLHDAGGRAMAHGSCPQVGSGGHFTIGGLGAMSREWGTALDHVLEAEVVLANASIVWASDTQNQDVFFAIKGAAASFGIVTLFKVLTHPEPTEAVQYAFTFTLGTSAAKANLFKDWQRLISQDTLSRKFSSELVLFEGGVLVSGTFFGSRDEWNAFELEKQFPINNSGNVVHLTNWLGMLSSAAEKLILQIGGGIPQSFYAKSMSFTPDTLIPDDGVDALFSYIDTTSKGTIAWFVIFDLEGGATNDVLVNATAYAHRETIMWMQSYAINFYQPVPETTKSFLNGLSDTISSARPGNLFGSYPGYVDPYMENPQRAYWGTNLDRLQQIKTAIDPHDIFHNPQSIAVISK